MTASGSRARLKWCPAANTSQTGGTSLTIFVTFLLCEAPIDRATLPSLLTIRPADFWVRFDLARVCRTHDSTIPRAHNSAHTHTLTQSPIDVRRMKKYGTCDPSSHNHEGQHKDGDLHPKHYITLHIDYTAARYTPLYTT